MRPLPDVIDAIKNIVPGNLDGREDLLIELDTVKKSALYSAPEAMHVHWIRFITKVDEHVSEDGKKAEWFVKFTGIVNGVIDYKDYL